MKAEELRKKTKPQLQKMAQELKKNLSDIRFRFSSNQLKNTMEIKNTKVQIARILTIIKQLSN